MTCSPGCSSAVSRLWLIARSHRAAVSAAACWNILPLWIWQNGIACHLFKFCWLLYCRTPVCLPSLVLVSRHTQSKMRRRRPSDCPARSWSSLTAHFRRQNIRCTWIFYKIKSAWTKRNSGFSLFGPSENDTAGCAAPPCPYAFLFYCWVGPPCLLSLIHI